MTLKQTTIFSFKFIEIHQHSIVQSLNNRCQLIQCRICLSQPTSNTLFLLYLFCLPCGHIYCFIYSDSFFIFCARSFVIWSVNVQGCAPLLMSTFIFLGRFTSPSAKPPFLEDLFVSLSLASLLRPVRLGRPYQEHKFLQEISTLTHYSSQTTK
jgi:hypothetical protein